jgi:WD40 repeat protein
MFAPDGSRLLVSSSDSGQTALLDAVTGTSLQNFSAQAGAFLPDGTLVIVNGSTLLHIHADGSTTLAEIQLAFDGNCYRMAVSPDGSRVALATANDSGSEVWIYGTADWKPLPRSHSAPDRIQALAFHPGAAYLALTHENGALVLDLEGSSTQSYMFENQGMARAVSFSPQGDLLAVAGDAGWLYVVRWAASDVIPPSEDYFMPMLLSGHQQDIHALSFTADGLLLSASRDGSVRLWDPALQQEISRLQI